MSAINKRYQRQVQLENIGPAGQEKLHNAKVLIIGAGGLGCPLLLSLVTAGVGNITIVDNDNVDESNLARQILFSPGDLNKNKAEIAARKLKAINPEVEISAIAERFCANLAKELCPKHDFLIDCTDNFQSRYLINDSCVEFNKPFISASLLKYQAQVAVYNFNNSGTYRCLFPEPSNSLNCADAGIINSVTSAAAAILANEAYKLITGDTNDSLAGKLLCLNLKDYSINVLKFDRLSDADTFTLKSDLFYQNIGKCSLENIQISPQKAKVMIAAGGITLLDVRNAEEKDQSDIGGKLIPLPQLALRLSELNPDDTILVYCQKGLRGQKACEILKQAGFQKLLNIEGGIEQYLES